MASIRGSHIQTRPGKQLHQFARAFFIQHGAHPRANWHPFFQRYISALEQQPELLPVHPPRLGEPVINIYQRPVVVPHRAIDLFFDAAASAQRPLRRRHPPRTEPSSEHVEKMDAVFDKNPSTLGAVPKPMLRPQRFVAGIVFEIAVQELAQHFALNQSLDNFKKRVIPLHQICDYQQSLLLRQGNHLVRLTQV